MSTKRELSSLTDMEIFLLELSPEEKIVALAARFCIVECGFPASRTELQIMTSLDETSFLKAWLAICDSFTFEMTNSDCQS
jgi:hypothetical protein